jgi:hypothetical protein
MLEHKYFDGIDRSVANIPLYWTFMRIYF